MAKDVVGQAVSDLPNPPEIIDWALPSPRLDAVAGMFDPADLMARFEVPIDSRAQIMSHATLGKRLAFYVSHAVGRVRERRGVAPAPGAR